LRDPGSRKQPRAPACKRVFAFWIAIPAGSGNPEGIPVGRRDYREMLKMNKTTFMLAAIAGLALTACVDTVPVVEEVDVMTIAPTSADRATPAYKSCVAAIAKQVGVSTKDVAVFDYQFSEAGTQIQASVAGAEAPWRCLSANDGTVAEVSYTGSEGAL
jgi:hypothetical protein